MVCPPVHTAKVKHKNGTIRWGAVSLTPKHAKNASLRAPKGRGNPYPCMCAFGTHTLFRAVSLFTGHRERIATPVCGLVRDDACSFVYRCLVRQPHCFHGLLIVAVICMTTGSLTVGLLLFRDLLPLLPVDGISAADDIVGAGLDRKSAFF